MAARHTQTGLNGSGGNGTAFDFEALGRFIQQAPHRVGIVIFPGASAYDLACASEVFSTANHQLRRGLGINHDVYSLTVVSSSPGPVVMEMGLKIMPDVVVGEGAAELDTVLVSGGNWEPVELAMRDPALVGWLGRAVAEVPRVASMCTGAFLLAAADGFQGKVTTHWAHCDRFAQMFPHLELCPDNIFINEGRIYSSAGATAAMDLALALVEEDLGRKLAIGVARRLVMFLKRPGGQSQFSTALMAQEVKPNVLKGVPEWILEHLEDDLSVDKLAARAAMSPRNFARVFVAETGLTPAKFVERARVEKARMLIEETVLPLTTIAGKAGFEGDRQLRRAFMRWLNVSPSDYAARFRNLPRKIAQSSAAAGGAEPCQP